MLSVCETKGQDRSSRGIALALLLIFSMLQPSAFAISDLDQSFTYQGRLFGGDGVQPLLDVVDIVATILDPSGTCILYEERHNNIDLEPTKGNFSIQIGSKTTASYRRTTNDPGLTMSKVFG